MKKTIRIILISLAAVIAFIAAFNLYFHLNERLRVPDENLTENYEIYLKPREEPAGMTMNEEGLMLIYFDDLVITDKKTGEEKVFDFFEDLAHQSVKPYLENIPAPTQYYLRVENLEASKDGARFTGSVELYPSADPPMSMKSSYFQITPGSWKIDLNDQPDIEYCQEINNVKAITVNSDSILIEFEPSGGFQIIGRTTILGQYQDFEYGTEFVVKKRDNIQWGDGDHAFNYLIVKDIKNEKAFLDITDEFIWNGEAVKKNHIKCVVDKKFP
jgi:hypothetical protein